MRKLVSSITLLFLIAFAYAQDIKDAHFKLSPDGKTILFIELRLDNGDVYGINKQADIAWVKGSNGRRASIEYSDTEVKYYDKFDIHDPMGKLKSIANVIFKYNNKFDIHDVFGTLKSIGNIHISYNNTFDIHDPKGSIKSVGAVQISYFNTFDPNYLFGQIKSIKGNSESLHVFIPLRRRT